MNVQLGLVVSDIDGETGLRIIEAILAGVHNPEELVKLRDYRIKKSTVAEMKAWAGLGNVLSAATVGLFLMLMLRRSGVLWPVALAHYLLDLINFA